MVGPATVAFVLNHDNEVVLMRVSVRLVAVAVVAAGLCTPSAASAWTWPVDGPVLRAFSFGSDPYAAGQHRGIDIGSPSGSPVVAPAGGTVSFAGTVPTGGKTVTILTPTGYAATLLHLGSIRVLRGTTIEEGAAVGTVGPSGVPDIPEPYVYLGIRVAADDQGYLDPLLFLPPRPQLPAPPPAAEPTPAPASETPAEAPPAEVVATPPLSEAPPVEPAPAPVPAADTPATTAGEGTTSEAGSDETRGDSDSAGSAPASTDTQAGDAQEEEPGSQPSSAEPAQATEQTQADATADTAAASDPPVAAETTPSAGDSETAPQPAEVEPTGGSDGQANGWTQVSSAGSRHHSTRIGVAGARPSSEEPVSVTTPRAVVAARDARPQAPSAAGASGRAPRLVETSPRRPSVMGRHGERRSRLEPRGE